MGPTSHEGKDESRSGVIMSPKGDGGTFPKKFMTSTSLETREKVLSTRRKVGEVAPKLSGRDVFQTKLLPK